MAYTVKAVAELVGISIRTLHHYDALGLLKPAQLSDSGYRLYSDRDLELLQQVLFFRELGFSLREIKEIIYSPGFDRRQALMDHKKLLLERQDRIGRLIRSVDRTLEAIEGGVEMEKKDMFDGFDQSQYEEEARQRWGHTEAYRESARRASQYTQEDWTAIQQESQSIEQGLASLTDRDPADPEVQALIRRHHQQINDRFYPCPAEMYRGLADMYVQDERFTEHYDKIKPGLARFVHKAIHVFCDQLDKK